MDTLSQKARESNFPLAFIPEWGLWERVGVRVFYLTFPIN